MAYEEQIAAANDAVEFFNHEIKKIFPDAAVAEAKLTTNIADVIYFRIAVDPYEVTIHNAHTYTAFSMFISNPARKVYASSSIELLHRSFRLRDAGVKFRKINAKTYMEATKKLLVWFEKNKELYEQVSKYKLEKY